MEQVDPANSNRTIDLYNNLIRDVKKYFVEMFNAFLSQEDINIKNKDIKSAVYPLLVREFFKKTFDKYLVDFYESKLGKKINKKKLYFIFGSFLQPKTAINTV